MRRRGFLAGLLASSSLTHAAAAFSLLQDAVLFGGASKGPSLDLNFIANGVDPRIAFSRASGAGYFDATGTFQTAPSNTPRIDYGSSPGGVTNWIRNSTAVGAITQTIAPLVSLPSPATNWVLQNNVNGLSVDWSAVTDSGFLGLRSRFYGTTSSSPGGFYLEPESRSFIPVSVGQTWTASCYYRTLAGTLPTGMAVQTRMLSFTSSGAVVDNVTISQTLIDGTLRRASQTLTVSATAAFLVFNLVLSPFPASTAGIDFTFEMLAPQLEKSATASPWVPTSGAVVNQGAVPLGLLIEEQRTNSIPNPRCEGAANPSTQPTGWTIPGVGGALTTATVVGNGYESGIPYVDFSFVTNSATAFEVNFGGTNAASNGQVWTGSFFARLLAGANTNLTQAAILYETGGTTVNSSTVFVPTSAPLATQRNAVTRTNVQAGTTAESFRYNVTASGAATWTIRIGAPQLELGAFATSLCLPTVGSPAATTRAVENASIPLGSWFKQSAGSCAAEIMWSVLPTVGFPRLFEFNDGTTSNSFNTLWTPPNLFQAGASIANVSGTNIAVTQTPAANVPIKIAHAYDGVNRYFDVNATGIGSGSCAGAMPTVSQLNLGNRAISDRNLNGYLRRLRYWPRTLNSGDLAKAVT